MLMVCHTVLLCIHVMAWQQWIEFPGHIYCTEQVGSGGDAFVFHFALEPEDIKRISLGAIWNFSKATGLP